MQLNNWKHWAVGGVAALTLIAGNGWMAGEVLAESGSEAPATQETTQPEDVQHPAPPPIGERLQAHDEYLANALGISVEELQSAMETARDDAAVDAKAIAAERLAQAVEDGRLTQEQADAMTERMQNADRTGFGGHFVGMVDDGSYLADALGISVEELQAAKEEALAAGLAQAVEDGKITQEQADDMLGMVVLRDFLADELDGVLSDAIQQAVDEGVITQEQADRYLKRLEGFGGLGGDGMSFFGSARPFGELQDGFGRGHKMMPGKDGTWPDAPERGFDQGMRPGPGGDNMDSDGRPPRRPGPGNDEGDSTGNAQVPPTGSSTTVPQSEVVSNL